jgi:hypothetical protein
MISGNGPLKKIIYIGPSMYPLFRNLDTLFISPYHGQPLQPGDVIVFKCRTENKETIITHRIFSKGHTGIITKGDNNGNIDLLPVNTEDILGIVRYARRCGRTINVYGGVRGRAYARSASAFMGMKALLSRLLMNTYHMLSTSGIFRISLPANIKTSIINLQRPDGVEQQLVVGRLIIGKRRAGSDRWGIMPPFRLFINEMSLPKEIPPASAISQERKP